MNSSLLDKNIFLVLVASLLVTAFFIYFPDPRMGYVLDDHYAVDHNPAVKAPSIARVFSSGLFDSAKRQTDSKLNYYRPLLTASFALDYRLWGNSPFAQRIENIIIHVLNCLLVFILLYALFKDASGAGLAAIIFCVLPIHEWSVRYIVGRGDILSAFMTLASLVALVFSVRKGSKVLLYVSTACFLGALLSKESALLNLAYGFLTVVFLTGSIARAVRAMSFWGMLALAYYILRQQFFPISAGAGLDTNSVGHGLWLGMQYLAKFWVPSLASMVIPFSDAVTIALVLVCGVLLWVGIRRSDSGAHRSRACLFSFLWIALGLLQFVIVQRIIPRLGPVLAEHFLYLTAVGFAFVLAVMIDNIRLRLLRKIVVVGFLCYFIALSVLSGRYWISERELLTHIYRMEGRPYTVAYEQLLMRYVDDERAVQQMIVRATSVSSQSVWYRRLGDIYHKRKLYPLAIDALKHAAELNPGNIEAINQWAVCELEDRDPIRGLELLRESITVEPQQSDAYRLSGVYFYRAGKFREAVEYFQKALRNDPDEIESSLHLMMAYYFLNDQVSYLRMVDRLGALDQVMVLRFAAIEFYNHGLFRETVKIFDQASMLFKNDPAILALATDARHKIVSLPK